MEKTVAVNFESFYYFELLNTVRQKGQSQIDGEGRKYLDKLLVYLEEESDSSASIEKLAASPNTSDLAIFFADLLEQLPIDSPESALKKLGSRSEDFLEIFQLFLQNEEWREAVDLELSGVSATPAAHPEVDFEHYRRNRLQEKINNGGSRIAPEHQDAFIRLLNTLVDSPETARQLRMRVRDDRVDDLIQATSYVNTPPTAGEIDDYMSNFESNADVWVIGFANLFNEYPSEMAAILYPDPTLSEFETATPEEEARAEAEAPESPETIGEESFVAEDEGEEAIEFNFSEISGEEEPQEELPMESLFEEGDDTSFSPELEAAEQAAAEELDDLTARAHELEHRQISRQPLSDEEKERKQFLRDYVISEVNGYSADILSAARTLQESPNKNVSEGLRENLKGLKDLGQIHAYPALEQAADNLLQIFNQLQDKQKTIGEKHIPELETLFDLFPTYIDEVINNQAEGSEEKILNQLSILHANLFDSESVSGIQSAETMEGSFQDVVTRYAVMIDEAISGDVDEERLGNLDPAFHNLLYWSDALDLQGAMETVEKVRRLMQFERFTQLDAPQRQMLSDIVKSWEAAFISTPESVWEAYNVQLDNLLEGKSVSREVPAAQPAMPLLSETPDGPADEDEAVSVDQALPAFMEVAANALASLEGRLHDDNAAILAANDIPKTMRHLADTAGAMGEADIERAFRNIYRQFAGKSEADMPEGEGFVGGLNRLLRGLRKQLQAGNAENIDEGFADLFDSAEEEDEEDEILKVFRMEALNYLEEMSAHVSTLEIQGENAQALREIGMTAHTLKGSAQMVGRGDVAELAEPLDKAIDLIENKSLAYTPELVKICRSFVTVMKERVQNHSADTAPVLASLSSYISQNVLAPTPKAAPQETPESSRVEKIGAELDPDYIYLREQDAELLQIFQNEVSNNFDDIERNLANLEKFTYDKAALKEVEQSVHEIRGAAKMLGIGEIADLTERLEQIFEKLVAQKKENMGNTIPVTRRAMHVIRELSGNFKVRKEVFNEVDNSLNALLNAPETAAADQPVSDPQMSAMIDEDLSGDFTALTSQLSAALAGESSAQSLYGEPEGQPEAAESEAEEKRTVAPQVLELYLQEAREQLEDIDYLLLKLEKDPDNLELQHHLMRCMHTLKGSSGMVYAAHVEALSHRSEDILEHNIQEKSVLSPHLFDLMGDVVKEITLILDHLARNGGESVKDFHSLIERLDGAYQGAAPAAPLPAAAPVPGVSPIDSDMSGARKDTYLRLNINKMNHLLNLAAELVISNNQFKTQLDRLKNFIPMLNGNLKTFRETEDVLNTLLQEGKQLEDVIKSNAEPGAARESMQTQVDRTQRILRNVKALQDEVSSITHNLKENSKTYDENLQKLNKLSNELLDEIMQARLVPINMLFQRFHRPIRDLARQLQKQIKLSIKGETTELDRTLIDELYEPLLHVIRNAIDHGLETVDQRTGAGKDGEGLLEIKARRDRNQVIIEVTDDGKGIDLERVKSSAIEKGLLTAGDAANMSDQELFEYLFYPGFSTAKETTMVSGRGVGLDAVKAQIEKAKGDIRMFSEPGKGTTFSIRVPISLSVIQSMLVDVTGHVYSIPLLQVEETLNVIGQDLLREDGRYYIRYREEKIPVVQLSKLLRMRGQSDQPMSTANQYPLVMVQDEGNRVALHVDKIIRREEILIKSLGPGLRRLKYISGGSIMADGQVVLVLDIPQVIQHLLKGGAEEAPETGSPEGALPLVESASPKPVRPPRQKKQVEGRKPVALIVDDSLSIRKYLSSLLMQKGYITDTARNGYEALELLNKQDFDIMVTDLEMPKLSGYELIETLRYDQRFAELPIIVLTGRAGENFRQLTNELGADAYIIKPFKDRELFEQIEKFIEHKE